MKLRIFVALLGSILFGASTTSGYSQGKGPTCKEFRQLVGQQGGLTQYELAPIQGADGNRRIPGIDLDGDRVAEDMVWFCPGSSSRVPADPCKLSVKLSSGGEFEFEESRFFLIRYESLVYAIAAETGPNRSGGKGSIYRVSKAGVVLICSKV